ncbi:MAG: c-type cytochrome [Ignavibacteria bacterium]|jgi:mono/diheme cytochrome c family protein
MKLRTSQIILVAAGLGLAVLLVMVFTGQKTWFSTNPPIEIQPNLDHQFKAIPQSPNSFFADGKSLREPVEGAVPRNTQYYTLGPGDIDAAETANVEPADLPKNSEFVLARGQNRFNTFCSPCHYFNGESEKSAVSLKGWAGIPNLTRPETAALSNARIFHIISAGQNLMPSYADKIDAIDRWAIIRYLRTLQGVEGIASNPTAAPAAQN